MNHNQFLNNNGMMQQQQQPPPTAAGAGNNNAGGTGTATLGGEDNIDFLGLTLSDVNTSGVDFNTNNDFSVFALSDGNTNNDDDDDKISVYSYGGGNDFDDSLSDFLDSGSSSIRDDDSSIATDLDDEEEEGEEEGQEEEEEEESDDDDDDDGDREGGQIDNNNNNKNTNVDAERYNNHAARRNNFDEQRPESDDDDDDETNNSKSTAATERYSVSSAATNGAPESTSLRAGGGSSEMTTITTTSGPKKKKRFSRLRNLIPGRRRSSNNTNGNNDNNNTSRRKKKQPVKTVRKMFLKGNARQICNYVRKYPEVCFNKYWFGNLGRSLGRVYPFMVVCGRKELSCTVIETVYDVCKSDQQTILGSLHYACSKQMSVDVIKFLISVHPDGARSLKNGWLPLHSACAFKASVDVVKYLVYLEPNTVQQPINSTQKLPLHIAAEYGAALEVVQLLVSLYPQSVKKTDYYVTKTTEKNGWLTQHGKYTWDYWTAGTVLHLACGGAYNKPSLELIKYLARRYPDALRTKNHQGWLPLHFACYCGASIDVIRFLVVCCPEAILQYTNDYRFPVEMACSRFDANYTVVQFLISKHPPHEKPRDALYRSYLFECDAQFAPWQIVDFLHQVLNKAQRGYQYVLTREDLA